LPEWQCGEYLNDWMQGCENAAEVFRRRGFCLERSLPPACVEAAAAGRLASMGDPDLRDRFIDTWRASSGGRLGAQSTAALIRSLTFAGDPATARREFRRFLAQGQVSEAVVSAYLITCADWFDPREAETAFQTLREARVALDRRTHTALAYVYGRAGMLDGVEQVFSVMEASGCLPESRDYPVLIRSRGVLSRPEAALHTLDQMRARGLKVGPVSMEAALQSLARAGDVDEIMKQIKQSLKLKEPAFDEALGLEADLLVLDVSRILRRPWPKGRENDPEWGTQGPSLSAALMGAVVRIHHERGALRIPSLIKVPASRHNRFMLGGIKRCLSELGYRFLMNQQPGAAQASMITIVGRLGDRPAQPAESVQQ
jgi:pentatricopeptide repeat protein